MEEIFERILKDANQFKFPALRQSCCEAQALLFNQLELMKAPPYELREKCLSVLQEALESKSSKLVSHAVHGLQEIVRDKSFQASFEIEDEAKWLPSQLVKAVSCINFLSDETQIDILKILLQMAFTSGWYLSTFGVLELLQLYCNVYSLSTSQVKAAAEASASQTLMAFCSYLQDVDSANQDNESEVSETDHMNQSDVIDDILPVLMFLCDKLKLSLSGQDKIIIPLLLQCLQSVLNSILYGAHNNKEFMSFIWQELCPVLIAFLGSPKTDMKNIVSQKTSLEEMGRGSGCLNATPSCLSGHAKIIYSISLDLVRLFGSVASLRPVLASLFHQMLLYPPPSSQHRLEALKALKDLFKRPELFVQFAAPPLHEFETKTLRSRDLDLLKIAMDSLSQCCRSQDSSVCCASTSCILTLLYTLENLMEGKGISEELVNLINLTYESLEEAQLTPEPVSKKEVEKDSLEEETSSEISLPSQAICSQIPIGEENGDGHFICRDSNRESDEEEDLEADDESLDSLEKKSTEQECVLGDDKNVTKGENAEENVRRENSKETVTTENALLASNPENITPKLNDESEKNNNLNEENLELPSDANGNQVSESLNEGLELDSETVSISSGTTEGPEDQDEFDLDEMDRELADVEQKKLIEEQERRGKAPRTLLGKEDHGKEERERVERLCEAHDEFAQIERGNAKHFVNVLIDLLPSVLMVKSSIEADQALQEFASKYCEDLWKPANLNGENAIPLRPVTIVNADGIYLATFSSLLLNLKLIRKRYYDGKYSGELLSEYQFIEDVHGSGVLVYLSATWLSEVFQQVMARNILEEAGYNSSTSKNYALINLISDIDGLGSTEQGGQLLSDFRRLERAVSAVHSSPAKEAGMKLSRCILISSWDVILEVLSGLLNGTNACGISDNLGIILGIDGAKEDQKRIQEAIAESLDALQITAKLCNLLGLQSSCGSVFAQLALASCPITPGSPGLTTSQISKFKEKSRRKLRLKKSVLSSWSKSFRLHPSHILSLDVILNKGLELGSHSPLCWKHVFRCCLYVMSLENSFFSLHPAKISTPLLKSSGMSKTTNNKSDSYETGLFLPSYPTNEIFDDYIPLDVPFIPNGRSCAPEIAISQIVKRTNEAGGVLKDKQLQPIVEGLSQLVDKLFDEAANRLNLSSLITFLAELCAASQEQLFAQVFSNSGKNKKTTSFFRASFTAFTTSQNNSLLMSRLADVMLHCARGGRPLVHVMKAWSVVAPHFVEAACHQEQAISKRAVTSIHDIVGALLSAHPELPHFHFNEALFKPLENLLCLELCDVDVQEHIISSICEFVEGCTTDVRSGWRPLFGALRAVRISDTSNTSKLDASGDREQAKYLRVVLDVFNAFLGTDNILVFANAAVDCLMCLLKHVRGPAQEEEIDLNSEESQNNGEPWPLDLCLAALKYIERCSGILGFMFTMPACPIFNSAHRIKIAIEPVLVDPNILNLHFVPMDPLNEDFQLLDDTIPIFQLTRPDLLDPVVTLESLDQPTGILHVWFLLVEGLVGAVSTCPRKYQPHTMETLFSLLQSLKDVPGPDFGIYSINHLLLPMLQNWLRRTTKVYQTYDNFATNFKQCCGLTTDLVVDYLLFLEAKDLLTTSQGVSLMFHQLLLVLTECIAQAVESVSRLGCACIRHVLSSAGHLLTPDLWEIACCCLERSCRLSLHNVRQLMACFSADSENFYGDVGQVKVAARKDCTPQESHRLYQLAQQVFLLDCQISSLNFEPSSLHMASDEERSFVFLLHPSNIENSADSDLNIVRVPFRNLVVGLVSHQVLLQTLATVLLQGTNYMLPSLSSLILSSTGPNLIQTPDSEKITITPLPGFLPHLSISHLQHLIVSLSESYSTACNFDTRPGLKFLIQKVSQSEVAANLYKQAGISWTLQALVFFELCLHQPGLNLDYVNSQLVPVVLEGEHKVIPNGLSNSGEEDNSDDSLDDREQVGQEKSLTKNILHLKENWNPFSQLKDLFYELCNTYADILIDKEGCFSVVDRIADEPIFLLSIPFDDFPELNKPVGTETSNKTDHSQMHRGSATSNESDPLQRPQCGHLEDGDKVYSVATEKTINNMMSEYKRRKTQHSLPARKEKQTKKSTSESSTNSSVPEEIVTQSKNSILKDSEARQQVWTQLIQSLLDLHLSLPDPTFKALLPVIYPGVQILVVYALDTGLRSSLAEWMHRVAVNCGFCTTISSPLTPET